VSFDIRQLCYAVAAADHGSFYRAARALEVEQSALSRAILKLERSIGMPTFERSRAGVTMTLAGSAFIRGAKPMVATADKLVAKMRAAGQGAAVSCFGWEARIGDLRPGTYALTIRSMDVPLGPARTRLLAYTVLTTTAPGARPVDSVAP
jgi:hypothetical protein